MRNSTILLASLIGVSCWFGDAVLAQMAVPVWTNFYNGPGNRADFANAVAVDGSGNVFVTGYTGVSGGSYDYATIFGSAPGARP